MKKAAVIIIVFLFFALVLGAVLYKVLAPSSSSNPTKTAVQFPTVSTPIGVTEQDPARFVQSFYTWYLQNYAQDHDFPHPENRNEVLSPWLASDLLSNWDQIVSEIDMNPVLLTPDDPTPWGNTVSAQLLSQSIRTSVIHVTIGSGENAHSYSVSLIQTPDYTWKISGVASAS